MIVKKQLLVNISIFTAMLLVMLLIFNVNVNSQEEKEKKTIMEIEIEELDENSMYDPDKPGPDTNGVFFTPEQDTNSTEALKLRIPALSRLELDVKEFAIVWNFEQELKGEDIWDIARNNARIPASALIPLGTEIVQRELMIDNALNVPFMRSRTKYGLSISAGDIASFLGLTEDVSPTITFNLDYMDDVEIKIYSVQAIVVATLFRGPKHAGKHSLTWNLRDDKGRPMDKGDYIAEVRIGKSRYFRKRIVIN
jgi:FlgD Ig-like domain